MINAPTPALLDKLAETSQNDDGRLLHDSVRSGLIELIDEHFVDGQKFWPESILTERLNVSRVTIRRALQDLSERGTLQRYRAKGTFVQKAVPVARFPKTSRAHRFSAVTLMLPAYQSSFWMDIIDSLAVVLAETGRALHICNTSADETATSTIDHLAASPTDEAIILMGHAGHETLDLYLALKSRGYRVVTVDSAVRDVPCAYVGVDNDLGVRMGARHLLELGHQRISMLVYEPPMTLNTQMRTNAFRSLMDEAEVSDARMLYADLSRNIGSHAIVGNLMDQLWDGSRPAPTAVFCDSDVGTLAALKWCTDRGVSVPKDVSLIGFDDTRLIRYSKPPITTIAQPIPEMARKAIELTESNEDLHVLLPPSLVKRTTTAPPPLG
ncbi:MAG TPA: substrate-binding domain-containing protein [Capsulimonadaceae bacterium]|jgi:DNA-binding LacI/PurR family transcriptional regulator